MNESKKKKVLIFSMAYFPRFVGGAEVAIKEITERLSDEFEFHLITLRYDSDLPTFSKEGEVWVHRIGFSTKAPTLSELRKWPLHFNKYLYQLFAFLKALALHRTYRFDLVWSMMAHSAGIPGALFKLTHKKIPYLLTIQEGDTPEHILKAARPSLFLFNLSFRYADAVQVISNFLGQWVNSMGAKRIEVIPNGVDLARFGKPISSSLRSALRAKMGVKGNETLLITTSRLVKKNGVDLVIEALTNLPDIHFAILGDGPEKVDLVGLVSKKGLQRNVTFIGEVGQGELPSYLSSADLFVRASRSEGLGISFIESMASRIPTIGTNVGGIPDLLQEGETGFLAEPESVESLRSAIQKAQSDKVSTARVVEKAAQAVLDRYDWNLVSGKMRDLFKSL